MNKQNEFLRGYMCAVAALISTNGVDIVAIELFNSGTGHDKDISSLREAGVDESDLSVLERNWQSLTARRQNADTLIKTPFCEDFWSGV